MIYLMSLFPKSASGCAVPACPSHSCLSWPLSADHHCYHMPAPRVRGREEDEEREEQDEEEEDEEREKEEGE